MRRQGRRDGRIGRQRREGGREQRDTRVGSHWIHGMGMASPELLMHAKHLPYYTHFSPRLCSPGMHNTHGAATCPSHPPTPHTFVLLEVNCALLVCHNLPQVHNVWVPKLTKYLYLTHSCYGEAFFLMVGSHLLQGHNVTRGYLLCLVHLTIGPLPNLADDLVSIHAAFSPRPWLQLLAGKLRSGQCVCSCAQTLLLLHRIAPALRGGCRVLAVLVVHLKFLLFALLIRRDKR